MAACMVRVRRGEVIERSSPAAVAPAAAAPATAMLMRTLSTPGSPRGTRISRLRSAQLETRKLEQELNAAEVAAAAEATAKDDTKNTRLRF